MKLRTILTFAALGLLAASAQAAPPRAKAKATVNWVQTVVPTPEGGMRMGNPNAAIKLVEYGSRTCPHCALFDKEGVPPLKAKYVASGQVSYEFRDFPIHNALDLGPILLGRCVPPRFFFPILNAMMEQQQTLINRPSQPSDADLAKLKTSTPNQIATFYARFYGYIDLMKANGLPEAKAMACLSNKAALDAIVKQAVDAGKLYDVHSTPTFILNGSVVSRTSTWEDLERAMVALGAK